MRLQSNNGITSDALVLLLVVSVPPIAQKSRYKSKLFPLLVSYRTLARICAATAFLPISHSVALVGTQRSCIFRPARCRACLHAGKSHTALWSGSSH